MWTDNSDIATLLQIIRGEIQNLPVKQFFKDLLLEDIDLAIRCLDEGNFQCVINSLSVIIVKIQSRQEACLYKPLLADIHPLQQRLLAFSGEIGPPGPPGIQGETGATGPSGPAGGLSEYGYIYKLDE